MRLEASLLRHETVLSLFLAWGHFEACQIVNRTDSNTEGGWMKSGLYPTAFHETTPGKPWKLLSHYLLSFMQAPCCPEEGQNGFVHSHDSGCMQSFLNSASHLEALIQLTRKSGAFAHLTSLEESGRTQLLKRKGLLFSLVAVVLLCSDKPKIGPTASHGNQDSWRGPKRKRQVWHPKVRCELRQDIAFKTPQTPFTLSYYAAHDGGRRTDENWGAPQRNCVTRRTSKSQRVKELYTKSGRHGPERFGATQHD